MASNRKPSWVRAAAPSVVTAASAAASTGNGRQVPITSTVSTPAAAIPADRPAVWAVRWDSIPSA